MQRITDGSRASPRNLRVLARRGEGDAELDAGEVAGLVEDSLHSLVEQVDGFVVEQGLATGEKKAKARLTLPSLEL